jgi:hypothetical protein
MSIVFLNGPTLSLNVLGEVEKHGRLYTGTLQAQHFINLFETSYNDILTFVKNSNWFNNPDYTNPNGLVAATGKIIRLMHIALNLPQWRDPWVASVVNNQLQFDAGFKRVVATALTKDNPWLFSNVLFFNTPGINSATILQNPIQISNNQQLANVFKDALLDNTEIKIGIKFENNCSYLTLFEGLMPIANPIQNIVELRKFTEWKKQFNQPCIFVVNKKSTRIIDTYNFWNQTNDINQADYILELHDMQTIYLEDLILWMDLYHDKFKDHCNRFTLTSVKNLYRDKTISVRHF